MEHLNLILSNDTLRRALKILTTAHQLTGLLLTLAGMGEEGMTVRSSPTLFNFPALSIKFIINDNFC